MNITRWTLELIMIIGLALVLWKPEIKAWRLKRKLMTCPDL